jgi:hypothetical protein
VLKNALDNEREAKKYLLMADYILEYENPEFDNSQESDFLTHDLEIELAKN